MAIDPRIILGSRPIETPDALQTVAQVQQIQGMRQAQQAQQQNMEARRLQMDEASRMAKDQEILQRAYQEAGGDYEKLPMVAAKLGARAKTVMDLDKERLARRIELQRLDDAGLASRKYQNSQFLGLVREAEALPDDQYLAQYPAIAARAKALNPDIQIGEEPIPKAKLSLLKLGMETEEARLAREEAARKEKIDALKVQETGVDIAMKQAEARGEKPLQPKDREELRFKQEAADRELARMAEAARHNRMTEGEMRRYHNMSFEGVSLGPEAKEKMAEMFAQTGILPTLGAGKAAAAAKSEIINLASRKYGDVDFATNKAAYQANVSSMRQLQKTQDAVTAFEETAGKNIDTFLEAAKGVIDTGSPILNRPARLVAREVFGSKNQTAFEAARETALTEAAKVLESPGGSAAITVSGREAIKHLSDPNATVAQMVSAMKILKRDMQNRKLSGTEQIEAIKGRIKGAAGSEGAPAGGEDLKKLSTDELFKRLSQ